MAMARKRRPSNKPLPSDPLGRAMDHFYFRTSMHPHAPRNWAWYRRQGTNLSILLMLWYAAHSFIPWLVHW